MFARVDGGASERRSHRRIEPITALIMHEKRPLAAAMSAVAAVHLMNHSHRTAPPGQRPDMPR
ncbi:hypothetical protein GCM10009726_04540 [Nocardioides furvisabuli]|uniref:Uncharacterized protein n=1 Tax=Nocardioides furvisabuli TaxID=375542 RepID=A0ABN2WRD3_9ACTN